MKFKIFTKTLMIGIGCLTVFIAPKTQAGDNPRVEINGNEIEIEKVNLHPQDDAIHIFSYKPRNKALQPSGSHFDIQLIDSKGHKVKEITSLIPLNPPFLDVWRSRRPTRRFLQTVKVSNEILTRASLIRVIHRSHPHRDCS